MSAWYATFGHQGRFLSASIVDADGRWIAAGLFQCRPRGGQFVGTGPGDYLDIAVDRSLDHAMAAQAKRNIVSAILEATDGPTELRLKNLPVEQGSPIALKHVRRGIHTVQLRSGPAPTLDIAGAEVVLKSKNVRRCENRLRRHGSVTCETFRTADEILPRLDGFFEQHVRRWKETSSPSLFHETVHREFYRQLTRELSDSGLLRFTEVRLDGALAAAHYGFFDAGRFVWYKPSYEPAMSELSPGVVLIARLVQIALDEGANELDFTIGDEAFKSRYATRQREVVDLLVTRSRVKAARLRASLAARGFVKNTLAKVGVLGRIKSMLGR